MALRADDVDLGRDRDLVERYQNGDPSAFDELYRRYFRRLHRFCQRYTRDVHEAEEIAQEAFVKALRSMDSLTGERRFYPWMTVIARRLTIDRHRKLARVELTEEPDLGTVEPDLDHLFDAVDADHVRAALGAVGPRHRDVLLLRESEGLSYAQIAEHLDVPVTTVEALLHRARKALRREYAAVTAEPGGLWSLPVFGLVATKLGGLRARLSERWVEAVSVGAPVVAGAVTAALVLTPGTPDQDVETAAPVALERAAVVETAPEAPLAPDAPVSVGPPATGATAGPTATPAAPTVEAGPVDVFLGPDGTERARDEARRMPLRQELGPAFTGLDPRPTLGALLDEASRALRPQGAAPSPLDQLLGGTP